MRRWSSATKRQQVLPLPDLHNLRRVCHSGATYCGRLSHGSPLSEIATHQIFDCPNPRIPAVIIGGELNGLGVCRSLAAGGISVWVVDTKRFNPALWSRHARSVLTDALHGRGFVDFLRDLQRRIGERPFLIVTDEPALLTISEHREELEALYRFRFRPRHRSDAARQGQIPGERGEAWLAGAQWHGGEGPRGYSRHDRFARFADDSKTGRQALLP